MRVLMGFWCVAIYVAVDTFSSETAHVGLLPDFRRPAGRPSNEIVHNIMLIWSRTITYNKYMCFDALPSNCLNTPLARVAL